MPRHSVSRQYTVGSLALGKSEPGVVGAQRRGAALDLFRGSAQGVGSRAGSWNVNPVLSSPVDLEILRGVE